MKLVTGLVLPPCYVSSILIHTSVKLVTLVASKLMEGCKILIHTSVKLVTGAEP